LLLFFVEGLKSGSLAGDGTALAAGICFGASMVLLRMNREGSPARCLFLSHCVPFVAGLPFILARPPVLTLTSTAAIFFLGIVQVGTGSLLYTYSIKRLRAIDAIFIAQLEPVLNVVWIFIFLGEVPAHLVITGGIILIGAVLMSQEYRIPRLNSFTQKQPKITEGDI
jgi:drug/metabolite transporter (DMT)-like permease